MVITRNFNNKNIDEIINKGGSVASERIKDESYRIVNLRIKSVDLELVDQYLKKRMGLSRNAWLLEAIQEKLKRERNEH